MYRAGWYTEAGAVAPGLDLGEVKPGQSGSLTQLLKNTGDQALSAVQLTLKDDLPGLTVKAGGQVLMVGQTHDAGPLAPGESLLLEYTRTVPADAKPGPWSAFVQIRALT